MESTIINIMYATAIVPTEAPVVRSHSQGIHERYDVMNPVSIPLKNQRSAAVNTTERSVTFATKSRTIIEKISLKLFAMACVIRDTHS